MAEQHELTPEEQAELNEMLARLHEQDAGRSQSHPSAQNIPWLALLGAALGAIPGILVWFGIGMLGYTWSLAGALIVIGVFFLYDKCGGDMDNLFGVIGCVLVCVIAVYLGTHLAWAGHLHKALAEYDISFGECVGKLYEYLGMIELKGKFFFAVLKGYLFAGLGAFWAFSKAHRR